MKLEEVKENIGSDNGAKSKKKKAKKMEQNIANKIKSSDDDFESLCEEFQKLDQVCNFPKCKKLVSTLGVTCKFCGLRFCLNHSMPEIHGCGEEARKAARQQILSKES